jgi:hypothetical protein
MVTPRNEHSIENSVKSPHPQVEGVCPARVGTLFSILLKSPTRVTVVARRCRPGPGLWLLLELGHSSGFFALQHNRRSQQETQREGISRRHMAEQHCPSPQGIPRKPRALHTTLLLLKCSSSLPEQKKNL